MDGTLTMMSEIMLMIRAIAFPRAYSARKVPPRTPDGDADQRGCKGDHQLSDESVSQASAFNAGGRGVIEEQADMQSAQAMDKNIGQDIHEPEEAYCCGQAAQGERDDDFLFFVFVLCS